MILRLKKHILKTTCFIEYQKEIDLTDLNIFVNCESYAMNSSLYVSREAEEIFIASTGNRKSSF